LLLSLVSVAERVEVVRAAVRVAVGSEAAPAAAATAVATVGGARGVGG
jgi:hypothetical protein